MPFTDRDVDPMVLAEALLDRTGEALHSGNVADMRGCFHLPQTISTFDCTRVIETEEEFRQIFLDSHEALKRDRITHLIRTCKAATRQSETSIIGTHESHYLSGQTRVRGPFTVLSTYTWLDGEWRIASSHYAVSPESPQAAALNGTMHGSSATATDAASHTLSSKTGDTT